MAAVNGTGDSFPAGQCTYYASERYHQLTNYWVPFSGNAKDWALNALAYGWTVSDKPVAPSIICLQAGVQGADSTYGHVGVVESLGKGTVTATNLNWGPTPTQVASVMFSTGPGVSFIYATGGNGAALGSNAQTLADVVNNLIGAGGSGKTLIQIAPNADVTDFLYAIDANMALINPFNVANVQQDTIVGVSFNDPISWVEGFGLNLAEDMGALLFRSIFIVVGVYILFRVLNTFIDFDEIISALQSGAQTAAMAA